MRFRLYVKQHIPRTIYCSVVCKLFNKYCLELRSLNYRINDCLSSHFILPPLLGPYSVQAFAAHIQVMPHATPLPKVRHCKLSKDRGRAGTFETSWYSVISEHTMRNYGNMIILSEKCLSRINAFLRAINI